MTKFYGLWGPVQHSSSDQGKGGSSYLLEVNGQEVYDSAAYLNEDRYLPPIQKSIFNEYVRYDARNAECNTSGYASESDAKDQINHSEIKNKWRSQSSLHSGRCNSISNGSFKEDANINRLKWGDRGIGIGYLWEPTADFDARLPEINNRPGTPHWLQKTLSNKSYLRGQSVPVEPNEVHEREKKRQKALELQDAIRQQLLEREKKRKADKDLQLEEERKLEQRIKEQQQLEKSRIDEELKKQKEKEEKENRKTKAMFEALVTAEQQAKEAKSKLKSRSCEVQKRFTINTNHVLKQWRKDDNQIMKRRNETENAFGIEKDNIITSELLNKTVTCDAQTSLTIENYFEEFKSKIPLITNKGTQTSASSSPVRLRKKMNSKSNNDRPKWGVNRPNTKYMKQSEKDPFYQRKLKPRSYRCRFLQEASGSSRSVDSTDECKSLSSSPHEKDFNTSLKQEKLKNEFNIATDCDLNTDQDESEEKILETEKDKKDRCYQVAPDAILKNRKPANFWENEIGKVCADFSSAISLVED